MAHLFLLLLFLCLSPSSPLTKLQLPPCQFYVDSNYNLKSCEQRDQCSREQVSSQNVCNRYSYSAITDISQCIDICCPDLEPKPDTLTPTLVKKCHEQYTIRYTLKIVQIVGSVLGTAFLLLSIACIYHNCWVRNPYTGKLVYVGCLCCKKNINFEEDYKRQMGCSEGGSESKKNIMDAHERKAPNLIVE